MSALSKGKIKLKNLSQSDDSIIMNEIINSKNKLKNAGHAGTVMRFMTAYLSVIKGDHILTGTERMKNRPIGELVKSLRLLGAQISYLEKEGFPPLEITGKNLNGGSIEINSGISSQYISALLMIGPYLKNGLILKLTGDTISSSYIDLTLNLMKMAGALVERKGNQISVLATEYKPCNLEIEADWSAASYWFSIAGLAADSQIYLPFLQLKSYQGDAAITRIFAELGVQSEFTNQGLKLKSIPVNIRKFRFDFRNNPDMVQTFIPYCIARGIPFEFSGCRTLRIKETDRVHALYTELKKFKVLLKFSEDGEFISWDGKTLPDWDLQVKIDTWDDHRMALGLAPLVIKTGSLVINDPDVVSKSYPGFWKDLQKAGFLIEEIH